MQRQIQVAALLLLAAACEKGPARVEPTVTLAHAAVAEKTVDAGPPPYSLTTKAEAEKLRVDIATRDGFHLNPDYPVNHLAEGGGRTQLKDAMEKTPCPGSAEESCAAVLRVPNVAGTLAFSVCSKDVCLIEKVALTALR